MKLFKENYTMFIDVWKRAMAAVDGKPFIANYLKRHEVETATRYERRINVSSYHNIPDSILQRWLQIQAKAKMSVEPDASLAKIAENVDRRGHTTETFTLEVAKQLYVFGAAWLLIDLPEWQNKPEIATEAARLKDGIFPYVSIYTQPNVINWTFDRFGRLTRVIVDTGDKIIADDKQYNVYADYTKGYCRRFYMTEKTKEIEEAPTLEEYPIIFNGQPVLPFVYGSVLRYMSAPDYAKSVMNAIIDVAIETYNRCSSNGSAYDFTDFQFLAAVEGTDVKEVGNASLILYPEGGTPPQWIAPTAANFEQTRKEIERLIKSMFELGGVKSRAITSDAAKSGTALKLEDSQSESKVVLVAGTCEQIIKDMWEMLKLANGTPDAEIKIKFPDSYDTEALQTELDNLEAYYKLKNNALYLTKFSEFIHRTIPDVETQEKIIAEAEASTGLRLSELQNEGILQMAINTGVMSLRGLAREINPELKEMTDEEVDNWIRNNADFAKNVADVYNLNEAAA